VQDVLDKSPLGPLPKQVAVKVVSGQSATQAEVVHTSAKDKTNVKTSGRALRRKRQKEMLVGPRGGTAKPAKVSPPDMVEKKNGKKTAEVVRRPQPQVLKKPMPFQFVDVRSWAKKKELVVNSSDEKALGYFKSKGYHVIPSDGEKWNEHSISHVSRDRVLLTIYKIEGLGKKKLRVLDYFGSSRNLNMVPKDSGVEIELIQGPNTAIEGDSCRSADFKRVPIPEGQFDVVFSQDVYHGTGTNSCLTPADVLSLCSRASTGKVYIMCRIFNGYAGSDDFGNGKEEQVWFRDEHGLIVSSPEKNGMEYAPHPDCNWLQKRSVSGLDCSLVDIFGPYSLFRCAKTFVGAVPLKKRDVPKGNVILEKIPTSSRKWWTPVEYQNMLVHVPVFESCKMTFQTRLSGGHTIDSLTPLVKNEMLKDFEMLCVSKRFPSVFSKILQGTVFSVLYLGREQVANQYFN
jgi:hypothetical protein